MKTFEEIRTMLSQQKEAISKKFGVQEIAVFGSFVRGEQNKGSDIDILVGFREPVGFFQFIELEQYLSNILGMKVDLVTRGALKPAIGARILRELVKV